MRHVITPTPLIVDEGCNSSRASLKRAFQVAHCPWTWERGPLCRHCHLPGCMPQLCSAKASLAI